MNICMNSLRREEGSALEAPDLPLPSGSVLTRAWPGREVPTDTPTRGRLAPTLDGDLSVRLRGFAGGGGMISVQVPRPC